MSVVTSFHRLIHPNLTGPQAVQLLQASAIPEGTFLFRPSSIPGDFALSVRCDSSGSITHIHINKNTEDCYLLNGYPEAFASLAELIQHCVEEEGLKLTNNIKIELKHPYYATGPTSERWFHTGINGAQAEQLLKEQGKNGSFLVRESQRRVGYVITVRIDEPSGVSITHITINVKNNKYDVGGGDEFDSLSDLIEHYRRHPMVETSGRVVHIKYPFNSTRIWARDLKKKIEFMEKSYRTDGMHGGRNGFWEEFEAIQQNECKHWFSRREGQKMENRAKNRFKNVLPYDHTRVVLQPFDDNLRSSSPTSCSPSISGGDTDYINANHIEILAEYEEFSGIQKKSYISCQGCLPNTIDDFWRMIWQEHCPVIVMTTKEVERSKCKCAKYWPDVGKAKSFGPRGELLVTCHTEDNKPNYMFRKFVLKKSTEERIAYHFQYTTWPDHGAPSDPGSVLNFLEEINDCTDKLQSPSCPVRQSVGPICVHCSAGIGRSGAFISIDLILSQLKKNGLNSVIDISRTVQMIRTQRSGMVQTETQYKFIYAAVQYYVETLSKHLAEHSRCEVTGRDYQNIRYTAESINNGQRTPTTPHSNASEEFDLNHQPTKSGVFHSATTVAYPKDGNVTQPIRLDPPPFVRRIAPVDHKN